MKRFLTRFLQNGFPGWLWAAAITSVLIFQELRGELSAAFASYAGAALTVWLGYRWVKNGQRPPEEPKE